ncbi:MAG: SDR family oxidoreductase [Chloroflexota bacterium]
MNTYLVTGGAGFIGSNIVEELLRQGQRVRVLDNFSTGRRQNLDMVRQAVPAEHRLEVIEGDLRSYHIVREAVQGIDYVLHQGALPSVPRSVRDPLTSNEVNVVGTLNLLQAAREAGVKRLVYASSSSVYGNSPTLPKVETMCPHPLSPYAISKLAAEQYCQSFWQLYDLETVCLRYFNVFGPRQDPTSQDSAVIPRFITAALRHEPLTIQGDGRQSRDFTYVANVVAANLLACQAPAAPGQVINASCGQRYSLLDLATRLEQLFDRTLEVEYLEPRAGDVKHSQADISRAGQILGYEPAVDFETGLSMTVDWYRR